MRGRIAASLAFLLPLLAEPGAADEEPIFDSAGAARTAATEARERAWKRLEEEGFLVPERFLEAERARKEAEAAWKDDRLKAARAAFTKACGLYGWSVGAAKHKYEALFALRESRPPVPRLSRFPQKKAVREALAWLARHQDPLGRWDCAGGGGNKAYDVGVTALALLAFLEAGYTDRDNHYALEVYRGLQWLRAQQDGKGVFGPGRKVTFAFIYNHAPATLALARARTLTKDERFDPALERALEYILSAQTRGAGWRYLPQDESDTSATTWCYRALAAGAEAGIELDLGDAAAGARAWVDKMTREDGCVGYNLPGNVARPEGKERFPEDKSRAMTAAGTVLRLLLEGEKVDKKLLQRSLDLCLERPPVWSPGDGSIDMYYWYYGSLACAADKKYARKWQKLLHKAVLKSQATKGARAGSWAPLGVWGVDGGRVYATALMALALIHAD